jgi:hypothetical protein
LGENLGALSAFTAKRPEFALLPAAGGWVAVLRAPRVRSEDEWTLELLRRGVVAHPGHFYELEGGAHLVVSLIVEPRAFGEGLARLESARLTFAAQGSKLPGMSELVRSSCVPCRGGRADADRR